MLRNPWDSDVLWYIWNPDEVIVRLRLPVIPSNQRNDGGEAYVREVFQRLAQKLRGFSPQLDDITIHDPESWRSLFENTHSAEDGSDWR